MPKPTSSSVWHHLICRLYCLFGCMTFLWCCNIAVVLWLFIAVGPCLGIWPVAQCSHSALAWKWVVWTVIFVYCCDRIPEGSDQFWTTEQWHTFNYCTGTDSLCVFRCPVQSDLIIRTPNKKSNTLTFWLRCTWNQFTWVNLYLLPIIRQKPAGQTQGRNNKVWL